jgi:hypothetical protein
MLFLTDRWVGENCDEYGTGTYMSLAFWGALAVGSSFIAGHCVYQLAKQGSSLNMSAANTSLMFAAMGMLSGFTRAVITMLNFSVVEGVPANALQEGSFGRYEFYTRNVAVPLLGFFSILALLNVALMWIEIARQSQRLRKGAQTNLTHSRKLVLGVEVAFIVLMLIGLAVQNVTGWPLSTFIGLPFTLLVIFMYYKGAKMMREVLGGSTGTAQSTQQATGTSPATDAFLAKVNTTKNRALMVGGIFVLCSLSFAFLSMGVKRELATPEYWLNLEKVLHHTNALALSSFCLIVWLYITVKKSQSKTNRIALTAGDKVVSFYNTAEEDVASVGEESRV